MGKGKPAAKGKPAPKKKVAPARKATTAAPASAADDLFYHKGTSGFVGDVNVERTTRNVVQNAFVFRTGGVFDPARARSFYEAIRAKGGTSNAQRKRDVAAGLPDTTPKVAKINRVKTSSFT